MGYLNSEGLRRFTAWVKDRLSGKLDKEEAGSTYLKKTGGTLPEDGPFLFSTPESLSDFGSVKFSLDPANVMSSSEDVAVISSGAPDMFETGLFLGSGRCLLSSEADQSRLTEFFLSALENPDGIHNSPVEISVTNYNDSTKSQIQIGDKAIRQQIESKTGAEAHMFFEPDRVEMQLCEGTLLSFYDTGGGGGSLELNGDPVVTQSAVAGLSGVPPGVIVMWSGATTAIPAGWVLCDGENGTPDLRDKFVLGAGNFYAVGDIGGEITHKLTVDEMPAHTHGEQVYGSDGLRYLVPNQGDGTGGRSVSSSSSLVYGTVTRTAVEGGSQPHNNMPPYYTLAYIMKL